MHINHHRRTISIQPDQVSSEHSKHFYISTQVVHFGKKSFQRYIKHIVENLAFVPNSVSQILRHLYFLDLGISLPCFYFCSYFTNQISEFCSSLNSPFLSFDFQVCIYCLGVIHPINKLHQYHPQNSIVFAIVYIRKI